MSNHLYIYWGDDAFALTDARHKLESRLLDPAWREFNLSALPSDAQGRQILEALLTIPFGAGNRLVVVKDAAFLASAKSEDESLAELERAVEKGLPQGAYLLLTAPKLDSRLKLVKKLSAYAIVREFSEPKPWQREEQLAPWVKEQVSAQNRKLGPQAGSALVEATQGDRWRLRQEIDKLASYTKEGETITVEMVRELVAAGDIEVFALTDAIAARNIPLALQTLQRLLTGSHALKILAPVATVMRNWLRLKQLAEQGLGPSAIAQAIGARSDFKVRKDLEALRSWRAAQLDKALGVLLSLDESIKSGRWPTEAHRTLWEKSLAEILEGV